MQSHERSRRGQGQPRKWVVERSSLLCSIMPLTVALSSPGPLRGVRTPATLGSARSQLEITPGSAHRETNASPGAGSRSVPKQGARKNNDRFDPNRLLIIGGAVTGSGLLLAAIGFGVFGGIHAGNPGAGLELEGDPSHADATLALARGMAGLGIVGASAIAAGSVVLAIGAVRYKRGHQRGKQSRSISLRSGWGSLSVFGRF